MVDEAEGPVEGPIEQTPTTKTIWLRGQPINLRYIGRTQHIDFSYLSRVLSGKRDPSRMTLGFAMKVAACLGWSVEDLIDGISARWEEKCHDWAQLKVWHDYREAQQKREDAQRTQQGLPALPRVYMGSEAEYRRLRGLDGESPESVD